MAVQLDNEVAELLADKETVKVLATIDAQGVPHAVIKQTIHADENGNLVYLELLESSVTNKNLVRSIWFKKKVSIAIKGKTGISYQITGSPIKAVVAGPIFQKHYVSIREKLGDVDLAAVWIIEPEEVRNQTFKVRKSREEEAHPIFIHLDRLAR
ncbi:MAG TPA: hypothetical protein PKA28_14295 [Methylomusa anaerophila]|uniref:Pyridoxamine 5'-phosphate oxidase putative domain-containing protein n=1 Tax=Methylomusa anaerophila TaxID=1930071 RepID=A0A348AEW9_9FIRM|nr:hypothetical protein [Methylomusa anaerophila]BBB89617.1 hypothetical protein MAMMFC1_00250 [Methylomusa anaerophila]HML89610.1 hypothetical protein [Methylomusa anaerophila]